MAQWVHWVTNLVSWVWKLCKCGRRVPTPPAPTHSLWHTCAAPLSVSLFFSFNLSLSLLFSQSLSLFPSLDISLSRSLSHTQRVNKNKIFERGRTGNGPFRSIWLTICVPVAHQLSGWAVLYGHKFQTPSATSECARSIDLECNLEDPLCADKNEDSKLRIWREVDMVAHVNPVLKGWKTEGSKIQVHPRQHIESLRPTGLLKTQFQ